MKRLLHLAMVLLLAAPTAALADDASEAQAQFEAGARLYQQRRFGEAIDRFLASNRLVPNANVVYNIALTYQLLGQPTLAYNWAEQFLHFPIAEDRRALGRALQAQLASQVALVDVATTPAGAEVYVDRADLGVVGRAPLRVAVAPGTRRILVRLDGHRPAESAVDAAVGAVRAVALALDASTGTLEVTTEPAGAEVSDAVTGATLGRTPLALTRATGPLALRVARRGRLPEERRVEIRDGERTVLAVTLRPDPGALAVLSIGSTPAGASVRLDARPAGHTPLSLGELEPARIRVEVGAPGRRSFTQVVGLEPGSATRLDVRLAPAAQASDGWKWLGYGGGAVLFIGGAALGLIGHVEREAFFSDPQRETLELSQDASLAGDILMGTGLCALAATLLADLLRAPPEESAGVLTVDR